MEWLKLVHVSCVILSFSGFFVRGLWVLLDSHMLQKQWVKILPHIVDSMLLASAVLMLMALHLSVFEHNWLIAKILALLIYIALGMLALNPGRSKVVRGMSWVAGLMVFLYIVSVALTKSPVGFINYYLPG